MSRMGPSLVLVNGAALAPALSPLDRGLHYGDGLFETLACRHGRVRFLDLHLERLGEGARRLNLPLGDLAIVRQELEQAAAGASHSLLKLILTRGEAVARGYSWSGAHSVTRVLLRYAWPAEDPVWTEDGIIVRTSDVPLGESPVLAGLKHLNRLEQVIARSRVPASEATELLMFSRSGQLVSGAMSNVFVVRDGRLLTPRMDLCGVAGVMRRVVLKQARQAGLVAEECVLRADAVGPAAELFFTNARIGIWPVRMIDGRELRVGAVTRQLQAQIAPLLENPVDA